MAEEWNKAWVVSDEEWAAAAAAAAGEAAAARASANAERRARLTALQQESLRNRISPQRAATA